MALNREVDEDTVIAMIEAAQADVVIAPGYAEGVVDKLIAKRANTRILVATPPEQVSLQVRQIGEGFLVQQNHHFASDSEAWETVTETKPTAGGLQDAALAWRVCGHVSSNSIVLAKDGVAWGIGAGQQNRVEAGELAVKKANNRAKGGACASDAFFPFADGLEVAAAAGVSTVIQPGGSIKDEEVIAAANELGLAMVFTGERQFRH